MPWQRLCEWHIKDVAEKTTYFLHVIQIGENLEKPGLSAHTNCACHNTM
jgi:hypothetical protein